MPVSREEAKPSPRWLGVTIVEAMLGSLVFGVFMISALPFFNRFYQGHQQETCIGQLKKIDDAKAMWADEKHKPKGADVHWYQLVPSYMPTKPVCPGDGRYALNEIGQAPTCSFDGHSIP